MLAPTPTTEHAICRRCELDFERPIPKCGGFGRLCCNSCRRLINNEASRVSRAKRRLLGNAERELIITRVIAAPVKTWKTWTPERIDELRTLIADGFSGGQIATRMGQGITRSGVMGKAARLGLVVGGGRKPPAWGGSQARRIAAQRERRKAGRADAPNSPKATHRPALVQCEGYTDIPPDHSDCAVPFLEIREGQCRYPVAPDGQPFMFCAAPAVGTYCPRHDRLCHRYTGPARSWHEGRRERVAG